MKLLSIVLFLFLIVPAYSQLPAAPSGKSGSASGVEEAYKVIDEQAISEWPSPGGCIISADGKHVAYAVHNSPPGKTSIVLTGISGNKRREFITTRYTLPGTFLGNNFIFQSSDTLHIVNLRTNTLRTVPGVELYKALPSEKGNWLAYISGGNGKKILTVTNLSSGNLSIFSGVTQFEFDAGSKSLLVAGDNGKCLAWIDLLKRNADTVWASKNALLHRFTIDENNGNQVAFFVQDKSDGRVKTGLWYYKKGMSDAVMKTSDPVFKADAGLLMVPTYISGFTRDGKWIFFVLKEQDTGIEQKPQPQHAKVDIWSYKDAVLRPEQMKRELDSYQSWIAVTAADATTNVVTRINRGKEELTSDIMEVSGDHIVIQQHNFEYWWQLEPPPYFYVVSMKDGSRKILNPDRQRLYHFCYSPDGRFIVYYDMNEADFFSIETATGKQRNVTAGLPVSLLNEYQRTVDIFPVSNQAEGWNVTNSTFLLYDNFDIWEIDLYGNKAPANLTNGLGQKTNIKFRLIPSVKRNIHNPDPVTYTDGERLLLTAFNVSNKRNGFYSKIAGKPGDPEKLVMSPHVYYRYPSQLPHADFAFDKGMIPRKAHAANVWIVQRGSEKEFPNYYVTTDFRTYRLISDMQPHKKFNWLTTELINFTELNGTQSQGILYKPVNFDPRKKYPVLFNYYEKMSFRLHDFPTPNYTGANINIPWFVSRGYLVFTPDIHYKVAAESDTTVGEWACNSVIAAARHLAALPYVDSNAMGIEGHSFGGLQTAYIVTQTNLFAAVAEVAGVTDPVSAYLTLVPFLSSIECFSRQQVMEKNHELWGCTPWQRSDLYTRGSAVLNAHKVTAPVLIMHNMKDEQVQWRQGVEFYMALRRLHKKCWMLQYDEGSHVVYGKDAVDFTFRLTQFFNHYLKGEPAPVWMTKGIPVSQKGIETGFDPDTTGSCGNACRICAKWKAEQLTEKTR